MRGCDAAGQGAVADKIEIGSVEAIGTRLSDHIHYGASGASQLSAVGVGGDAELLHYFVRKLIRRAIAAPGLPEKGVVVVSTIHQIAGLKTADAAKGEIAVGARGESPRILSDSGGQEREVGVAPAVQGQFVDSVFVDQR